LRRYPFNKWFNNTYSIRTRDISDPGHGTEMSGHFGHESGNIYETNKDRGR